MPSDHNGRLLSLGGQPTHPRMVTNQPKDGHPKKEMYYRFGIWHLHITHKLKPGDNCYGWLPTILRMVTHQPKDVTHKP